MVAKPQKKAEPVIDEASNILTGADDDDFIPIEDLPSEKIELPTELFGKFEATKTEPVQSAPEQVAQPQQQQSQSQQQRPRIVRPRDNNNANNNANNNFGVTTTKIKAKIRISTNNACQCHALRSKTMRAKTFRHSNRKSVK